VRHAEGSAICVGEKRSPDRLTSHLAAASSGPSAPSMFDDDDEKATADALEEEDGNASEDDAFVVAKPQVRVFNTWSPQAH
jgi:hypothetical protein